MSKRDRDVAHLYHESTKLFYLDLQRKPPAYKRYRALLPLPLPTEVSPLAVPTLEAVAATVQVASSAQGFDLTTLAGVLFYSVGRIRMRTFVGAGEITFRAAASAGGLYPIEAYVVCGDLPGLAAGVYHFSPADFALRCLRPGDYRGALARAAEATQQLPLPQGRWSLARSFGAVRGSIGYAPIATASGITAPSWPTCWPPPRRQGCQPGC